MRRIKLSLGERTILELVQSRQATSQIQMARRLGISSATINNMVRRMLDQGVFELASVDRRSKGRPLLHYRLRLALPMLAIQWLGTHWSGGVLHPEMEKDFVRRWDTPEIPDARHAGEMMVAKARELLAEARLKPREIGGFAISLNAARVRGRLSSSVIPWVPELDIQAIGKSLRCRTEVLPFSEIPETEMALRAHLGMRGLAVLNVGDGVSAHACSDAGSGIQTFRGEIGHIVVDPAGAFCGCGNRGCLETVTSGPSLQRRVREDVKAGVRTALGDVLQDSPKAFFDRLEELHLARSEDYAVTIAEEFLDRCAWGLSIICNTHGPDLVVLSGYGLAGREFWKERIAALASAKILHGDSATPRLEFPLGTPKDYLRRLAEEAFFNQDPQ